MHETMEIRRSPSGCVDTDYYVRNAHAVRTQAIRDAVLSFARFVRRMISTGRPHAEQVASAAE